MNKLIVLTLLIPFLSISEGKSSLITPFKEEQNFTQQKIAEVESRELDEKALVLKDYLAKHNSPLQYHAQDFIDASNTYNLDWKLVPAIAGVESTFGKNIPGGFNGWGWGVYGNQALYFKSWRDGIFTVSEGLRKNYVNKGLDNPFKMNRIYATSKTWGSKVAFFIADIDKFALENKSNNKHNIKESLNSQTLNSAGDSAKLYQI